jgi:hypothetical protein
VINQSVDSTVVFADLLARAGVDAELTSVTPCAAGGNNRIYRVETTAGVFAAKQYFRHNNDPRDRLAAEYAFLSYASAVAPGLTPRPFGSSPESGMALYEFIDGRRLVPGEIGAAEIDAATRFFRALNSPPRPATGNLPIASEACFSIADHLGVIGGRVEGLLEAGSQGGTNARVLDLFRRLDAQWQRVSESVHAAAGSARLDLASPLDPELRCLSPSDFGFHNALREPGGNIRFLDFEYAGWDDPAKTAGDFFAQLAVPVPPEFFEHFVANVMRAFPDAERLAIRARLLRPAYQIKWCCIALNVFLPVHLERRAFANPGLDTNALKEAQLLKADRILNLMDKTDYGLH